MPSSTTLPSRSTAAVLRDGVFRLQVTLKLTTAILALAAGVNSVFTPREKREKAWARLATDLDLGKINSMTSRARLEDVPLLATEILAGQTRGRVVIDL